MPEMRKRSADSHGEDRAESGAAVLGMLDFPQMPNDAESLRGRAIKRSKNVRAENELPPFLTIGARTHKEMAKCRYHSN